MSYYVSIIIAVFNCRRYIQRCIDSVLNQSEDNYELIIVDDGSTDGTTDICNKYKNHENVVVIHQNNNGHTSARKRGLKEAKGMYAFFLDADDWLPEEFIHRISVALQSASNTPDIISFNYKRVDEQGNSERIHSDFMSGIYDKELLKKNIYPLMLYDSRKEFFTFGLFPTLWSKLFRRDLINEVMNLLDEKVVLGEDAFCVFLSIFKCESLLIVDEYLYNYQIDNHSLSRSYAKDNFEKLFTLCNLMDNEYPEELRAQVLNYKLSMLMGAITNETRGPLRTRDIIKELKYRCEQKTFKDCINNTQVRNISLQRRLVYFMLKAKFYSPLVYILRILKV